MEDELKKELEAIRDYCTELALTVVSGHVETQKMPMVEWKVEQPSDCRPYLDLARRFQTSLVVLEESQFDEELIDSFLPEEDSDANEDDDDDEDSEAESAKAWTEFTDSCSRFIGLVCAYTLYWFKDGICFAFAREARWYSELEGEAERLAETLEDHVEEIAPDLDDSEVQRLGSDLARDQLFQKATTQAARRFALKKRFPEVVEQHRRQTAEIVEHAKATFELEIKPEVQRATDDQIVELSKSGMTKEQIAKKLGVSVSRVRRCV